MFFLRLQISPLTEGVRHVIDVIFNKEILSKSKINWEKKGLVELAIIL